MADHRPIPEATTCRLFKMIIKVLDNLIMLQPRGRFFYKLRDTYLKGLVSRLGSRILCWAGVTKLLNRTWNSLSGEFLNLFIWCFGQSKIKRPFIWKDISLGKDIIFPILPYHCSRLSWSLALGSRWVEPGLRRFSEIYIQKSKAPRIFFDVGSNHGLRSYPFLASGYTCVLFEPQAKCNEFVREVAKINNFSPIIEECILSDQGGLIKFYVSNSTYFSSVSKFFVEQIEPSTQITVKSQTLDSYCSRTNIYPSLLKIDVEGHEWQVICGAKQSILSVKPTLMVEIWPESLSKKNVFNYLASEGYVAFSIAKNQFIPLINLEQFLSCPNQEFIFCADHSLLLHFGGTFDRDEFRVT